MTLFRRGGGRRIAVLRDVLTIPVASTADTETYRRFAAAFGGRLLCDSPAVFGFE